MMFRRGRYSLGLCALLPLLGGCYRYAPAQLQDVRPGANVRARISAVEADRIAPVVSVDGARRLHAVLLVADTAGVLLEVPSAQRTQGGGMETLSQQVRLPTEGVVQVELRQLDLLRTGITAAAGAALMAVVIEAVVGRSARTADEGEYEVPEMRSGWMLLRLRW
jgi:hypothetical protein